MPFSSATYNNKRYLQLVTHFTNIYYWKFLTVSNGLLAIRLQEKKCSLFVHLLNFVLYVLHVEYFVVSHSSSYSDTIRSWLVLAVHTCRRLLGWQLDKKLNSSRTVVKSVLLYIISSEGDYYK